MQRLSNATPTFKLCKASRKKPGGMLLERDISGPCIGIVHKLQVSAQKNDKSK